MSYLTIFPDKGRAFFEHFSEHHGISFDIVERCNIKCDATRSGYLNAMTSKSSFDKFAKSAAVSGKLLGQNIKHIGASKMLEMTGSEYYSHGVLYQSGGRINPYLFTNGMVKLAQEKGARIFGDSVATTIASYGTGSRIMVKIAVVCAVKKSSFVPMPIPLVLFPSFNKAATH